MDRTGVVPWSGRVGARRDPGGEVILPSRATALASLRNAVLAEDGPVLLTGEPGTGKTWLCRRLRAELAGPWRWAAVELTPAVGAGELYRLILHAVGVEPCDGPGRSRASLEDFLTDAAAGGVRWGLIVEEAQNAPGDVFEELRVLANGIGGPGAFAAVVVVGLNSLARRLTTHPLAPFAARIRTRVHLRPIDVEEVAAWLSSLEPGRTWDDLAVERLHRETVGNPRRLLVSAFDAVETAPAHVAEVGRRVVGSSTALAARATEPAAPEPEPEPGATWEAPTVTPVRPPLEVGDEMIEVGWEPIEETRPESESESVPGAADSNPRPGPDGGESEEVVDDHYAALQAWTEWAKNQGREPVADGRTAPDEPASGDDAGPEDDEPGGSGPGSAAALPGRPGVWADGQQSFAPYSQLFTRLRQARDSHG